MKSTYYAARLPISSVCVCVCVSPHYTHCVDLSRRVTPEGRSPALLRSDPLNYTTLTPIAGVQDHSRKSNSAWFVCLWLLFGNLWKWSPGTGMSLRLPNHQYDAIPQWLHVCFVEMLSWFYFKFAVKLQRWNLRNYAQPFHTHFVWELLYSWLFYKLTKTFSLTARVLCFSPGILSILPVYVLNIEHVELQARGRAL